MSAFPLRIECDIARLQRLQQAARAAYAARARASRAEMTRQRVAFCAAYLAGEQAAIDAARARQMAASGATDQPQPQPAPPVEPDKGPKMPKDKAFHLRRKLARFHRRTRSAAGNALAPSPAPAPSPGPPPPTAPAPELEPLLLGEAEEEEARLLADIDAVAELLRQRVAVQSDAEMATAEANEADPPSAADEAVVDEDEENAGKMPEAPPRRRFSLRALFDVKPRFR